MKTTLRLTLLSALFMTTLAQAAALGWVILFYLRHSSLKIRRNLIRPRLKIILPALAIAPNPCITGGTARRSSAL